MSTIREVSRLAGVSIATVSRTLKTPAIVSSKTRELVLEAVEKAGYRPNAIAKNFSTGKSHCVLVLVPNVANPFFSRVIRGIEQAAKQKGYSILLGDTHGDPERENEYARMALTHQADGLIQLYSRYPFAKADCDLAASVPMVNACERIDESLDIPVVELDNRKAAWAMTTHLLELGHRRIAVITGPIESPIVKDRLAGYQAALQEYSINHNEQLMAYGDFTMASGAKAVNFLLQSKNMPTAIFSFSDEMAIGAMHQLKENGLSVPRDISVAGFDNIEFASYTNPPLTTINQPAQALGRQAMKKLYVLMNNQSLDINRTVLPFNVIVRESTAIVRVF